MFSLLAIDIPDGYRKFSTFEVDTRKPEAPIVSMKLWVDGKEAWKVDVLGKPVYPPVVENPVTQLGRTLAISLSELLGFGRNWF
jgi:alkaline phosphatase D